jgi:drug/metabolite transporter (DMT)-like permease
VRFDYRLVLAIGAVWFIWGSTFAGMHYAVATIPPFAMAAGRFLLSGAILYGVCVVRGRTRVTRADVRRAFVTGATLLLLGNGVTAFTLQYLPTGINALLLSCAPIWMAIIGFAWGGERPRAVAIAGMALGLLGLAFLLRPHAGGTVPAWAAGVAVLASVAWAFGSIYQRRIGRPSDLVLAAALQMLAGGLLLAIFAAVVGEWRLDVVAITSSSWLGFAWLVVFGGLIGYSAYQYTLVAASSALASTYAYVNPLVSVGLGYILFGERLTRGQAIGSAVIILGVALMMWPGGSPAGGRWHPILSKSTRAARD